MRYLRTDIARMPGYVPGEQPQGVQKFIKLNTNENPYPPSPAVLQALRSAVDGMLQRYPDPMASSFRQAASGVLAVPANSILCGNGSDDLLTIISRGFVGEGDLVRFPTPSYTLYRSLAELQGAQYEEVPFTADWKLDSRFTQASPRLKLAWLPNPNSPTGTWIAAEEIEKLAKKIPCPLVVDEAYVDFAQGHALQLVDRCDNLLVTRTLSKSYALAGLRFGFVVARPELIDQLIKVKDSYNCDSLSIAGATAAILDQDWLAATRAKIIAGREQLSQGLARLGFDVLPSQANFVWAKHPTVPSKKIYEQLKQQQLLIRYMHYPQFGDGVRITVGTDSQIDVLLSMLTAMVK